MARHSLITVAIALFAARSSDALSPVEKPMMAATSGSRRVFVSRIVPGVAFAIGSSSIIMLNQQEPANAYGEFEPGAKARRKAGAATSTTTTGSSQAASKPSTAGVGRGAEQDLKTALGGYSYGGDKSANKNKK